MSVGTVTAALFCLGLYGVLTRKDVVAVLASVELMLGAANVQIVAFGAQTAANTGMHGGAQTLGLIVLVLAAAEAAVGLALLIGIARRSGRTRIEELAEVDG